MDNQVLPAVISLFLPGVGQLLQGRTKKAITFGLLWLVAWFSLILVIGLILIRVVHIWACFDAAGGRPSDGVARLLLLAVVFATAGGCMGVSPVRTMPGPVIVEEGRVRPMERPRPNKEVPPRRH